MPQQRRPASSLQSEDSQRQALGMGQATTPTKALPRLPRGWSRVCHETGLFLRTIGLGILVTAFQGFVTKTFSEPEKVAIRQSRVTALLRALIHALPLGLAIFEIILNWKGHYLGSRFDKQNYLQFVAKGHEILIQSSIATIILSYIRYQISAGSGLPFGAVLGALQFTQISYLWSIEFWSAFLSEKFQPRKKIGFAVLILICITVAATAGPSSANLLIARQGTWPRKSKYMAVNATFQDIWPDRLDDEKVSDDCKVVRLQGPKYPTGCPVSNILSEFLDLEHESVLIDIFQGYLDRNDMIEGLRLLVTKTALAKELIISSCFNDFKNQVCSTAPQAVIVPGFSQDGIDRAVDDSTQALEGYHRLRNNYYQPYTTASCVADTVQNSSDQAPLRFVRLLDEISELGSDQQTFSVPGLTKGQSTYNIPGNISNFRVDWVDLPQDIFRTGVPGAIIVHPQSSSSSSYNITTCTLNAGWGSSWAISDNGDPTTTRSEISYYPPGIPSRYVNKLDPYNYLQFTKPLFTNFSNFVYPQRRINISKSWMEFIIPTVKLKDNSTTNIISLVLFQQSFPPRPTDLALMLSSILTDGLTSSGNFYDTEVFEERAQASRSCEKCLALEIENEVYGWLYTARGTPTKLAITVMLTYCVLVLGHLIYSAISGVSSTAWDSVSELVALAMNSSPTEALQNTCAGIVGRKAYETHVRILRTSEKHLELVFGEIKDPNADITNLVMNEKYGSIAVTKKDEDEPWKMEGQGELRKRVLG